MNAALLLSGGIESSSIAYWMRPRLTITVDYGQNAASAELAAAERVAAAVGAEHRVLRVDLAALGAGNMVGAERLDISPTPEWWPYRNQLLITLAAMAAVQKDCAEVWVGTVASDDVHEDGTSEFVDRIDGLVSMQEGGVNVRAPALALSTDALLDIAQVPMSLLAWTYSCHTSSKMCGRCRGCIKRLNALDRYMERSKLHR